MKSLSTKFIFNRKNRLNKNGEAPVEMRLQYSNETAYLNTGIYLKPEQWDKKSGRVIGVDASMRGKIEVALGQMDNRANTFYLNRISTGKPVNVHQVKKYLTGEKSDNYTFIDFCEDQLAKSTGALSYKKTHALLFKHLQEYRRRIEFEDLTYSFLSDFESYLLRKDNDRKTGKLSRNYVSLLLRVFKVYTNEAIKEGFLKSDPFTGFTIRKKVTQKVFLSLEELDRLSRLEVTRGGFAEVVRDAYLFASWGCGLRFSDIFGSPRDERAGLRVFEVTREEKGLRIKREPMKTEGKGLVVNVPLWRIPFGRAEEILERYIEDKEPGALVFGEVENSTANQHLKHLAKEAKITKHVEFHSSRHSFAMNLLGAGFSKEQVQKLLGHGSITTTEIYARLHDTYIDDLLDK